MHLRNKIVTSIVFAVLIIANAVFANDGSLLGEVTITGDSYANIAGTYAIDHLNFKNKTFTLPGTSIYENQFLVDQAIYSQYKYIMLCTSVNDHIRNTSLEAFENKIREYAIRAQQNGKILIMHTYMAGPYCEKNQFSHTPAEYDEVVRRVMDDYINTHYIDLNYIDNEILWEVDDAHPRARFFGELFEKVEEIIDMDKKHMFDGRVNKR